MKNTINADYLLEVIDCLTKDQINENIQALRILAKDYNISEENFYDVTHRYISEEEEEYIYWRERVEKATEERELSRWVLTGR